MKGFSDEWLVEILTNDEAIMLERLYGRAAKVYSERRGRVVEELKQLYDNPSVTTEKIRQALNKTEGNIDEARKILDNEVDELFCTRTDQRTVSYQIRRLSM